MKHNFRLILVLFITISPYGFSTSLDRRLIPKKPITINAFSSVSPQNWKDIKLEKISNQIIVTGKDKSKFILLENVDSSCYVDTSFSSDSSLLLSFKFETSKPQHDARLGKLPPYSNILAHSRIKRWWMAPSFHQDSNTIPVETQLLLVEMIESTNSPSNEIYRKLTNNNKNIDKKYALLVPLINFDRGFRVTFYGADGGYSAGNNHIGLRLESGDTQIKAKSISDAVFITVGNDPYELLAQAYDTISKRMGTFRTRQQKPIPPSINSFGYCTWDAFYSSVNGDKVLDGVQSLSKIGYTPRFLIIDDGWQSTTNLNNNNKKTLSSSPLAPSTTTTTSNKDELSTLAVTYTNDTSTVTTTSTTTSASTTTTTFTVNEADLHVVSTNLTGTPISGSLASQQMVDEKASPILNLAVKLMTRFYTEFVEKGHPNSIAVKIWTYLSKTVLKDKLIEFFIQQTDFSKRLASWKANSKFENPAEGKSLRGLVTTLKEDIGVNYVYVWHALSGYWGGVSEDEEDDLNKQLNTREENIMDTFYDFIMNFNQTLSTLANSLILNTNTTTTSTWEDYAANFNDKLKELYDNTMKKNQDQFFKFNPFSETVLENVLSLSSTVPMSEQTRRYQMNNLSSLSTTNKVISKPSSLNLNSKSSMTKTTAVKRTFSRPTPHLLQVEPALAWDPSSLVGVGSVALDKVEDMYFRMYSYLADAGIDGVKVDAQSGIGSFGDGNGGGSNIARACVSAMERNVRLFFGNPTFRNLLQDFNVTSDTLSSTQSLYNLWNFSALFNAESGFDLKVLQTYNTTMLSSLLQSTLSPALSAATTAVGSEDSVTGSSFISTIHKLRNQWFYRSPISTASIFNKRLPSVTGGAMDVNEDIESESSLEDENLTPISLVGCMCHSTENLFNFYETSLARVSDDFYPKDDASQTVHLVSCAYNSVMIGEIAIADWDMFHSLHPTAEMHAAARSISGGPVYVSDAPRSHNSTILSKLVLPNGRILRTLLPARPTVDCLFKNVMKDGVTALKIWSMNKMNGVIGVFNVQGASWDAATRKYTRHSPTNNKLFNSLLPANIVEAEVHAKDLQGVYSKMSGYEWISQQDKSNGPTQSSSSSYKNTSTKNKGSKTSKEPVIESIDKSHDLSLFVAWSSADKELSLLPTRNSVIRQSYKPRDWDIYTICHLHQVPLLSSLSLFNEDDDIDNNDIDNDSATATSTTTTTTNSHNHMTPTPDDDMNIDIIQSIIKEASHVFMKPKQKDSHDYFIHYLQTHAPQLFDTVIKSSESSTTTTTTSSGSGSGSSSGEDITQRRGKERGKVHLFDLDHTDSKEHSRDRDNNNDDDDIDVYRNMVYWAPIGLIDMFNPGAAVDSIHIPSIISTSSPSPAPSSSSSSKTVSHIKEGNSPTTTTTTYQVKSSFTARGPGKFGIFASKKPSQIIIDSTIDVMSNTTLNCTFESQSFGGYLIKFTIPSQGQPDRLIDEMQVKNMSPKIPKIPMNPINPIDSFFHMNDKNHVELENSDKKRYEDNIDDYLLYDKLRLIELIW